MTWWRRSSPKRRAFRSRSLSGDFAIPGVAEKLVAGRPDVIFHLAAIVSGEAELDFDKGYRINLDGTRMLFDAIRLVGGGYKPRVVFTSSIAVFGAPFPDAIGDEFFNTPLLELRHPEGDRRAFACRLYAARLHGRRRHSPADHLHSPGASEQGGVRLLLRHPARAARGQGSHFAGIGGCAALACLAALGGRLSDPCRDAWIPPRSVRGAI